ncbi:hypothetical protein GGX14DRAFT_601260 [Mycena pura]|uniref:Uncharacterized protein n=1 Tax=Mycena pura TaxID=153505 RepID=A0AAD6UNG7_9AGAR|nr:hypothetical protein GGX14DRAFT_601260 [Mycena pura]
MAIVEGYEASARGSSYYAFTRTLRSTSAISVKTAPTPSVKTTPAPAAICKPLIPTESTEDFISVLKTEIESRRAAVSRDDSISFAQITFPESMAPHDVLDALDKYDEDRLLKFDIDWVQSCVEVRVCMPSLVHEDTAGSVSTRVMGELVLCGDKKGVDPDELGIRQTGSARIHGPDKSKEADISFTPTSRMDNEDELAIPTVVVEVGYWESMPDLAKDAKDWLSMKDSGVYKVNLVILLSVYTETDRFRGELWRRDASGEPTSCWSKDLRPTDRDTTTPIPMEIQLADLYGGNIPTFLEGTGPIVLNLRRMASYAFQAKAKMAAEACKRKAAFNESDRKTKKARPDARRAQAFDPAISWQLPTRLGLDLISVLFDDTTCSPRMPTFHPWLAVIADLVRAGPSRLPLLRSLQIADTTDCGHWMQVENCTNSEEDGMHECLSPLDGEEKKIVDNRSLSRSPQARIVAVPDTCHSGSLLDLRHQRSDRDLSHGSGEIRSQIDVAVRNATSAQTQAQLGDL